MAEDFNSKLLLGGATLGNTYGVTNERKPENFEVAEIVRDAFTGGFVGIDTAPVYGDSESVLGNQNLEGKEVFTKISSRPLSVGLDEAAASVKTSISRLRVKKLSGLTFHSSDDFLRNPRRSLDLIRSLAENKLIESWGVSLYSPDEIKKILKVKTPDYFQAPVNLLDRRFLSQKVVSQMAESKIKLQARSLFLQGVLVGNPDNLPRYFSSWVDLIKKVQMISRSKGLSPLASSLCFAAKSDYVHRAVIGINSKIQLEELLELFKTTCTGQEFHDLPHCTDEGLIDPRNWDKS